LKVELLKHPTKQDWLWCKQCTLNTVGLKTIKNSPNDEWKKKLIESEHSPIRELWFGFRLEIPYWVSVHLVRHHIGCNHYVQTQRDDRQKEATVSRSEKPQGELVSHIISINAQELIQVAHKRLCLQASKETREVVQEMCRLAIESNPEMKDVLVPLCEYRNHTCTEMFPCGKYPSF
jgi:hypothetical protein